MKQVQTDRWHALWNDHQRVMEQTAQFLHAPWSEAVSMCASALGNGHKLLFCGNGGSAADSQHLATECTIRLVHDRRPLAALALTTDTSALTACGNDYGFSHLFARQIDALGQQGDVLIALSTSGNSDNCLEAASMARRKGLGIIAMTGEGGGKLGPMADCLLAVPSTETARIQEMHITIGHALIGEIEHALGLQS